MDKDKMNSATASNLSVALAYIFEETKKVVSYDISLGQDKLRKEIIHTASRLGFILSSFEIELIEFHLEQERNKFGVIQKFIFQENINDIIIKSHDDISIQVGRKNIKTNTRFASKASYENFIEKILNMHGQQLTIKNPIIDAVVDNCRFNFVHESLALGSHYCTIRINRFNKIKLDELVAREMLPDAIKKYLESIIKIGKNILVVGEVGVGKTTLSRALLESVPITESILVIEDSPEIHLDHPQVRYLKIRQSNSDGYGEVTIAQCIKAGMRMAMNRLVLGEIRDGKAAQSFIDISSSGHPGVSTIHAGTPKEALLRLENFLARADTGLSENAIKSMIGIALNIIITVGFCSNSNKRKVMDISELNGVSDGMIRLSPLLRYESSKLSWKLQKRQSVFHEYLTSYGVQLSTLSDYLT